MYTDKVMDHFMNPRNVGEIEDADGIGKVGNPTCGDLMMIFIKVDEHEIITDIKFKTFGCGAAIATSSMVTELALGKSLEDALSITRNDVAETGSVPVSPMTLTAIAPKKNVVATRSSENTSEAPMGKPPMENMNAQPIKVITARMRMCCAGHSYHPFPGIYEP